MNPSFSPHGWGKLSTGGKMEEAEVMRERHRWKQEIPFWGWDSFWERGFVSLDQNSRVSRGLFGGVHGKQAKHKTKGMAVE